MKIVKRHERIRLDIIKDLIKYDLLVCRPISQRRDTVELDATTRRLAVAEAPTRTMATEHAQ